MNDKIDMNSTDDSEYIVDGEYAGAPLASFKIAATKPPKIRQAVKNTGTTSTTPVAPTRKPGSTTPVAPTRQTGSTTTPVAPTRKPAATTPSVAPSTAPVAPPKPTANTADLRGVKLPEKSNKGVSLENASLLLGMAANALSAAESIKNLSTPVVTLDNGTVVDTETQVVTLPHGTVVDEANKTVTLDDGGVQHEDGNIKYPDGRWYLAESKTWAYPDGTFEFEDGTLTDKDGNTIGKRDESL